MKTEIVSKAEELGLKIITTTTGPNGYPKNLKEAIIGFDNFAQAEEFAEEFEMDIEFFETKSGWDLYERTGNRAYEPLNNTSSKYGDNYSEFGYNCMDEETFYEDEIKPFLENCNNIDELESLIKERKELWSEIEKLDENQIVITQNGLYYETIENKSMSFSHDTKTILIGVIEYD